MSEVKKSQESMQIEKGEVEKGISQEPLPPRVDFCCCCSLKNESFYLFVNMLDLVFATFISMMMGYLNVGETSSSVLDYLKVALGTLNILLFALAMSAFIVYLIKLKFNTAVHKIYSIVRLVVCGLRYSFFLLFNS